jgi:hypothetical protein
VGISLPRQPQLAQDGILSLYDDNGIVALSLFLSDLLKYWQKLSLIVTRLPSYIWHIF